jgi:hypothetical protein
MTSRNRANLKARPGVATAVLVGGDGTRERRADFHRDVLRHAQLVLARGDSHPPFMGGSRPPSPEPPDPPMRARSQAIVSGAPGTP